MIGTTSSGYFLFDSCSLDFSKAEAHRRRAVTDEAKRALMLLSHAVDHLTVQLVTKYGAPNLPRIFPKEDEYIQAIRILMSLNRQVYLECKEIPRR